MTSRKKPRVITNAVADKYSADNERTIEFASDGGGGLINFRVGGDGRLQVSVYRCDGTVDVLVGTADNGDPTPIYQNGNRMRAGRAERVNIRWTDEGEQA